MKRNYTFLMAAFMLLAMFAIPMGMKGQTKAEVVSYTLDGTETGGSNGYATESEITQNGITWMVTGNTTMNPWRIGGKNLSGENRPLYSTNPISDNITKVVVTNGTANLTVNSMTLIVSANANFSDATSTVSGSWAASSTTTFERPTGTDWSNMYFKLVYNVTAGTSNQYAQLIKVEFFKTEGDAPAVATPTFDPASGTEFGDEGLSVTISCETDDVDIYYTTDGTTPDDESNSYSGPISLTGTTTIKAIAYDSDDNSSAVATAIYTYVDPNAPGTENNPYTVAEARAAIDANTGLVNVYATGIISQVDSYNSNYNSITYWISDDGSTTSDQLEVYSGKGLNNTNFSSINDIEVGATVVVYGTLKKYNSIYEFDKNNYLVSYEAPTHEVETPTFSPAAGTYAEAQTVTISCETQGVDIYYTLDGSEPNDVSEPYSGSINVSETTTIKAIAYDGNSNASTVATATYHICSQANPYTVAQALDFNEYPANGIYVHGIVSTAPTQSPTNNGELTYYISDDGEATDQLEVYKGKGLEQAAFTAQDDIQLGDIVTIYGNVQVYNSTIEFGTGNYLVEFERPAAPVIPSVTVTPATIDAPAEGADGTLTITYENIEDLISFDYYFCDAEGNQLEEDPNWIYAEIQDEDDTYSLNYIIDANDGAARTAYMKVYTFDDELEEVYVIVTVTQAEYVAPALDYAELPFEFDGGRADIENTDGLTQDGLDSDYNSSPKLKFNTTGDWLLLHFNEKPGTLTFDIKGNSFSGGTFTVQTSEDGETYTDLATYTSFGSSTESEEFINLGENVRYIKWIYTEKSSGNVALGNIMLAQYTGPVASITVDPATVDEDAEEHDGTLGLIYENLTISDMEDFGVQYYDAEGEETTEPEWIEVLVAEQDPQIGEGYVVSYFMLENEGEARTAYFKVWALGDDIVYSNLVTIKQAAPVATTPGSWVLTSLEDLTEDDIFVIVGTFGDDSYAMANDITSAAPAAISVIVEDGTLSDEPAANLQWNVSGNDNDGYIFYPNGDTENWLYCNNSNNGVRVGTNASNTFKIESGYLKHQGTSRYVGIYLNNPDWRCYTNTTGNIVGQTFAFYKKVETSNTETYTLDIKGYETGSTGGYYLIASPVTVDPSTVDGMTDGEFDLFYFDESAEAEWRNYKQEAFNIVPGKGYLYAKEATTEGETFHFELTGTPYNGEPIVLSKAEGGDFPGWNLVGNPYGETAYIDREFYVMKDDGSEIITGEGNEIAPMQGIFVKAAYEGEEMTFSTVQTKAKEQIVLNITNCNTIIDRAIVRFDNNDKLPKMMLNERNTKVYFREKDDDYAVVHGQKNGKLPINFEASRNGDYIINVNVDNMNLSYLHLIDHQMGEEIDLLKNPVYKFEAKTTDEPKRFVLVYKSSVNPQEMASRISRSADFSFYNNDSWFINNEGEAVLQVIDANGRILSNEVINGSCNKRIEAAPGVYMIRLINGNDVKTQKVIVK